MSESELRALGFLEWSILVHSSCQLSDALSLTVDWPRLQEVRPHAPVQAVLCVAITSQSLSTTDLLFLCIPFHKTENVPRFSAKMIFFKKKNTLKTQ